MPVKSSIWIVREGDEPWATDPETGDPIVGTLATGYVYLTRPDLPATPNPNAAGEFHVLHGSERAPTPSNAHSTVAEKSDRPWATVGLPPWVADFVYEAEWEEDYVDPEDGETYTRIARGKVVEVPDGVVPVATGIWPHVWLGETP